MLPRSKEILRSEINEKFYLSPFNGEKKTDLYSGKIERECHGVLHPSRAAALIVVLVNMLRDIGYKEIDILSEQDIFYYNGLFFFMIRQEKTMVGMFGKLKVKSIAETFCSK